MAKSDQGGEYRQPYEFDERPLYVNPKQFHRILKRRMARQQIDDILGSFVQPSNTLTSETFGRSVQTSSKASAISGSYDEAELPQDEDPESVQSHTTEEAVDYHPLRKLKQPDGAIGDDGAFGKSSDHERIEWPYSSRYFVAELMHAEGTLELIDCDSDFRPTGSNIIDVLTALIITKAGARRLSVAPSDATFESILRMGQLEHGDSCAIFVPQKRLYPRDSTINAYGIQRTTWMQILTLCDVPPEAVEILHDNNGGWAVHTSYCSDVKSLSCPNKTSPMTPCISQCAYHIWMKPQHWWNEEHFVYARHDFHSRKNFLLVAGTSLNTQMQRLLSQFNAALQPHLFSILLALASAWVKDLERFTWDQDFDTQRLETDTGWSSISHTQSKPLPPEKLALRKDMILTKERLDHVIEASGSLIELFTVLSKEMYSLPSTRPNLNPLLNQLRGSFSQHAIKLWHQKGQARRLIARIDAQWNIVNALLGLHNNSLNYQIATDSRVDTVVMRRISFVTIAFLPATFLATCFSMVFFHITSGHLIVSPTIWIYVVCVIPITLVIAWQSSTPGLAQVQWLFSKMSKLVQRYNWAPKTSAFKYNSKQQAQTSQEV